MNKATPHPAIENHPSLRGYWAGGIAGIFCAAIVWAYWPTLVHLASEWERQPDYSHGFLVAPIALAFLWLRRSSCPVATMKPNLWGLLLLAFAGALRVAAGLYYMQPLDAWTIPFTVAGAILLVGGWEMLKWSLPAVIFLWFMAPIPYSAERWMSVPLQNLATKLSTMALVCFGQPAISEGNVILVGEHRLFVEEACSGLRIFVGIFALAFAFVLFSRWSWWQKAMVLIAALPVAILANVTRIVATGLLQQWVSGEAAHKFSHDVAGLAMIPFAALIFWLFLLYMGRLFTQVEDISPAARLQQN